MLFRSALFGSDDEGRSFWLRHWFGVRWDGDVWTPRTASATGDDVWVLQAGRLHRSSDGGWSFGTPLVVDTGATAGDLTGSETGGPVLYMALRQSSGEWNLHRSDDAGATSNFVRTLDAFWGATTSMVATSRLTAVSRDSSHSDLILTPLTREGATTEHSRTKKGPNRGLIRAQLISIFY